MNSTIENIIKIAKAAKLENELATVGKIQEETKTAPFRVYVCGEVRGKDSFLQKMLETDAPFPGSARSKVLDMEICYAEQDACYYAEQKVDFSVLLEGYDLPSSPTFQLNCELLKKTGAVIHVPSPESSPLYAEDCKSVEQALGVTDCCIYILNATHACSREDVRIITLMMECHIPVFVTAVRFDQIDEEEQDELLTYMKRMTPASPLITTFWTELTGDAPALAAREFIQETRANLINQREERVQAAYHCVMARAIETLEKQLASIDEKYAKVEDIADGKKREMIALLDFWRKLKDDLDGTKKILKAEVSSIAKRVMERCTDRLMLSFKSYQRGERKLSEFCEVNIPNEVKLHLSETKDKIISHINRHLQQTCMKMEKNLQNFVKRSVPEKVYSTVEMSVETATDDTYLLTNNEEKIKQIAKIGINITGGAVALIGFIFSKPVVGITGATMLLPRAIDHMIDWFKKGDKEKDLKMVEEHIRLTVDKHRLYLEQEACNVIDDQYEKIFDAVAEYKKEWEAGYEREIQKETQIARFNIQKQKENLEQLLQEAKAI